jgi:hypothetical protein
VNVKFPKLAHLCGSQVPVEKWQAIFKQFLGMMIIGSLKKWPDPYLRAYENSKEILVLDYLDILNIHTIGSLMDRDRWKGLLSIANFQYWPKSRGGVWGRHGNAAPPFLVIYDHRTANPLSKNEFRSNSESCWTINMSTKGNIVSDFLKSDNWL